MIAFFPKIYEDELIYSVLARYYLRSGIMLYRSVAEELFEDGRVQPDVEFLNRLKPEMLEKLTYDISLDELIKKHTMLPFYAAFVETDKRKEYFDMVRTMQPDIRSRLPVRTHPGEKRYLRACPLCVKDDRRIHGETYWHRTHQMSGIRLCPIHGIPLVASRVVIGKSKPELVTAEEAFADGIDAGNEIEIPPREQELSRYIGDVFALAEGSSEVPISGFLHLRLVGTPYLSARGGQRNMSVLYHDIMDYYADMEDNPFASRSRLEKLFTGYGFGFKEVCMIGMFLDVSSEDLIRRPMPEKGRPEDFDQRIRKLHDQGMNYRQIADMIGGSYDYVKRIGEGKREAYLKGSHGKRFKPGCKQRDWKAYDEKLLPVVLDAIESMRHDQSGRPRRITVRGVERETGIPGKGLYRMSRCIEAVHRASKSWEEYWAEEYLWAYNKLNDEGQIINWKQLRNLTNTRPYHLFQAMPFIEDKNAEVAKTLKELLERLVISKRSV